MEHVQQHERPRGRNVGVCDDALMLHVDVNAASGLSGPQGLGTVRHLDLRCLRLQAAARGKQLHLQKTLGE